MLTVRAAKLPMDMDLIITTITTTSCTATIMRVLLMEWALAVRLKAPFLEKHRTALVQERVALIYPAILSLNVDILYLSR